MQKSAEMLRGYVRDIINCSFVAKLSSKKIYIFLKKYLCFLQNIRYLQKKNVFIWKKNFYREKYK